MSSITHTHSDTQTTTADQLTAESAEGSEPKFGGHHWNEWEMRRDALKMAALVHCRTRSTQTDRSGFRRDASTQYSLPQSVSLFSESLVPLGLIFTFCRLQPDGTMPGVSTQTMVTSSTNTGRSLRVLSGIQGELEHQVAHTVELHMPDQFVRIHAAAEAPRSIRLQ